MKNNEDSHYQRILADPSFRHLILKFDIFVEFKNPGLAYKPADKEINYSYQNQDTEQIGKKIESQRHRIGAFYCCPALKVGLQQVIDIDQQVKTETEKDEGVEEADNRPGLEEWFLQANLDQCFDQPRWKIICPVRRLSLRNNEIDPPKTLESQSTTD